MTNPELRKYVLELLRRCYTKGCTFKEIHGWAIGLAKLGTTEELKQVLADLKAQHLVRYEDTTGWVATA